jgi:hypothetical protein
MIERPTPTQLLNALSSLRYLDKKYYPELNEWAKDWLEREKIRESKNNEFCI